MKINLKVWVHVVICFVLINLMGSFCDIFGIGNDSLKTFHI